jgi:hypothetical protein
METQEPDHPFDLVLVVPGHDNIMRLARFNPVFPGKNCPAPTGKTDEDQDFYVFDSHRGHTPLP